MKTNRRRLRGKRASPRLRQALLRQRRRMHEHCRTELAFVVDLIRYRLPAYADHPNLPYLVEKHWRHVALSVPCGWIEYAAPKCEKVLRQHPWSSDSSHRDEELPAAGFAPLARLLLDLRAFGRSI